MPGVRLACRHRWAQSRRLAKGELPIKGRKRTCKGCAAKARPWGSRRVSAARRRASRPGAARSVSSSSSTDNGRTAHKRSRESRRSNVRIVGFSVGPGAARNRKSVRLTASRLRTWDAPRPKIEALGVGWSDMDVGDWLRRIGFGQYETAFRDKRDRWPSPAATDRRMT